MTIVQMITVGLGLGLFNSLKFEWLHKGFNNMTLGVHCQEWEAREEVSGTDVDVNELYIGLLFCRFVFEFYKV